MIELPTRKGLLSRTHVVIILAPYLTALGGRTAKCRPPSAVKILTVDESIYVLFLLHDYIAGAGSTGAETVTTRETDPMFPAVSVAV